MSSYNMVILVGNLTRDPELKHTPKGTAVCGISLAINRKYSTEAGESREEVSFIDCDSFGKTAENVAKFFRKGGQILVQGRLKQDTWEHEGQKRSKLKVVIDKFEFVGKSRPEDKPASKIDDEDVPRGTIPATVPDAESDGVPF